MAHAFTTTEDWEPISWEIIREELAYDEEGEPYSMLVAERDYAELEEIPDHELEHTLAVREAEDLPDGAAGFERVRKSELEPS